MTPWRVWAEKTGRVTPVDLSGNPYVQYGIAHEDEARDIFMKNHTDVVMPTCGEADENRIFRASFDGLTSAGEPVEIKCPGESTLEDVLARGENSDAYQHYRWQVQWQMLVAGADQGWLVFFLGNGKLKEFLVKRDEAMISELKTKCLEFWGECPLHGGSDGFRFFRDFKKTGQCICNTCGAFDGLHILMKVNRWNFFTALKAVSEYLNTPEGIEPISQIETMA